MQNAAQPPTPVSEIGGVALDALLVNRAPGTEIALADAYGAPLFVRIHSDSIEVTKKDANAKVIGTMFLAKGPDGWTAVAGSIDPTKGSFIPFAADNNHADLKAAFGWTPRSVMPLWALLPRAPGRELFQSGDPASTYFLDPREPSFKSIQNRPR